MVGSIMKQTTIELRKIVADEGYVLTNGEAYGKEIYLGKNDSAENWHEITEAEYNEIMKQSDLDNHEEA